MFLHAYSRAKREDFRARLEGKPNDLLPFEALKEILHTYQQIPLREVQTIPLDKIVGSVGRYRDFTRDFLPRNLALAERWARVENAMDGMEGVPPIEVYKVGDVYFVADGNHRVSVARANRFNDIDAYVTEIPIDAGLQPGDTLDEAIIKASRARFLAETKLADHFEGLDIYFTRPGGYTQLLRHIEAHRALLNRERVRSYPSTSFVSGSIGDRPKREVILGQALSGAEAAPTPPGRRAWEPAPLSSGEVSFEDAAVDWYIHVYQPIATAIRDRQLLQRFPNRTAADLYAWIWHTIEELYGRFSERISPDEAAALLELRAPKTPSPFQQAVQELMARLGDFSRAVIGGASPTPAWADPLWEWGDTTP